MDEEERDQFWQELNDIADIYGNTPDDAGRLLSDISDCLDRHSLHPGYSHP